MTIMQLACAEVGSPSIKSIEITYQPLVGTDKGESSLVP
jgi:hypothetical protein